MCFVDKDPITCPSSHNQQVFASMPKIKVTNRGRKKHLAEDVSTNEVSVPFVTLQWADFPDFKLICKTLKDEKEVKCPHFLSQVGRRI